jgi:predicted NAD-dependent protein-ADP-ribosyltransferase YbiA (DUF1768 family)
MRTAFLLSSLLISSLCLAQAPSYPDIWWQAVPESDLASWEIPPQAADRSQNQVILSKRNELGMLSNFYAAPFDLEGLHFASVEGLWQSMKYPEDSQDPRYDPRVSWPYSREQVQMMTAFEAKDAGEIASRNMKILKINWLSFKCERIDYKGKDQQRHYEIIYAATEKKISQNPNVRDLLLRTGNLTLLPDHKTEANPPPAYEYYKIAMKIRDSLK